MPDGRCETCPALSGDTETCRALTQEGFCDLYSIEMNANNTDAKESSRKRQNNAGLVKHIVPVQYETVIVKEEYL